MYTEIAIRKVEYIYPQPMATNSQDVLRKTTSFVVTQLDTCLPTLPLLEFLYDTGGTIFI